MPQAKGQSGPWRDHRQVVEGIVFRYRTGVAWRDLPERFGPVADGVEAASSFRYRPRFVDFHRRDTLKEPRDAADEVLPVGHRLVFFRHGGFSLSDARDVATLQPCSAIS
jgi:hypothetical protein